MAVTLKDIAERVNKSVPTVSRALGDFNDISPDTRREVQRIAIEMGYVPSATARSLQKQSTETIGLILPGSNTLRFSDPFFSEFLSGVVEEIAPCGFHLNISVDMSGDERATYLQQVRSRRVDGFIVVRTRRQDSRIDVLREHGTPFVAFGRVEEQNDFPFVDEDGVSGTRKVVDHLVSLGHTRLACIAEPTTLTKSHHRVQGFLQGMEAHGLPFSPELLVETNFRQQSGRRSAHLLFELVEPPTAIVACNDLLALGAITEAKDRGLVVGRDVSITGFDDIMLAEYANPALTTVHQPAHEIGITVAQLLLKLINKEPVVNQQIIINPSLVVRESSGPPPVKRAFYF